MAKSKKASRNEAEDSKEKLVDSHSQSFLEESQKI